MRMLAYFLNGWAVVVDFFDSEIAALEPASNAGFLDEKTRAAASSGKKALDASLSVVSTTPPIIMAIRIEF
jgi:hypothetical protein